MKKLSVIQSKSGADHIARADRRVRTYLRFIMFKTGPTKPSIVRRAALGLLHWRHTRDYKGFRPSTPRNVCILSGRPRGVYSRFGVARTKIGELSSCGLLLGARKSSW